MSVNDELSEADYQKEALRYGNKLRSVMRFIYEHASEEFSFLTDVTESAIVVEAVNGLEVDCASLKWGEFILSYTWDWLDARTIEECADEIVDQVIQSINEGKISSSSMLSGKE